ncbi:MAG: hypothetical protein ACD_12C00887G0010 [uncultured bacterium]|nr:MAG: hypothetical protein ACD_12C00887G0010 [uncultured bacterium]
MKLSKKILERGRKNLKHDLFYGRKSFRFLKRGVNSMLQDSSKAWNDLPQPITKKDKEDRELTVGIASLGSVLLARIREAEEYRRSIKFRNCKYKKYIDTVKKRTIFKCKFFKTIDKEYKTNFFCISNKSSKKGYRAELIKTKINIKHSCIEEGRFRFLPRSFTEFNLFLYPKTAIKYGYSFMGKNNEKLYAKFITNKNKRK